MDEMTIKLFVAKKLQEGVKLSDIQTMLVDELDCKMTFLELRLLAAELEDVDWSVFDPQEKKTETPEAPAAPADGAPSDMPSGDINEAASADAEAAAPAPAGATKVELSRLSRPGAMAHGTVTFGSGVTAEWLIDEMGRLGLDKVSGQPTENDVMEFQNELRKLFGR